MVYTVCCQHLANICVKGKWGPHMLNMYFSHKQGPVVAFFKESQMIQSLLAFWYCLC